MELKDFVKSALRDIVTAVAEAREEVKGDNVIAPPLSAGGAAVTGTIHVSAAIGGVAQMVEFDLTVVVTDGSEVKAGGSAKAGILNIVSAKMEASGTATDQKVLTQRLKFSVPVRFPQAPRHPTPPRQEEPGESWKTV